jgi:hypothetical protein
LFNANSAIFQLYHAENKFNFQRIDDEVRFVLDQQAAVTKNRNFFNFLLLLYDKSKSAQILIAAT